MVNKKKLDNKQFITKKRYKMYKLKTIWVVAPIIFFGLEISPENPLTVTVVQAQSNDDLTLLNSNRNWLNKNAPDLTDEQKENYARYALPVSNQYHKDPPGQPNTSWGQKNMQDAAVLNSNRNWLNKNAPDLTDEQKENYARYALPVSNQYHKDPPGQPNTSWGQKNMQDAAVLNSMRNWLNTNTSYLTDEQKENYARYALPVSNQYHKDPPGQPNTSWGIPLAKRRALELNNLLKAKEQAKADIDAAAEKVKGEIDADGTLTAEEKAKQKALVDQEAEKAKGAIAEAKDTDGVNQAKANGIKAMDDQHKSGDPVESRKEQAKADIDAAAEKVKGEIDADGTLTAEEKAKQKALVDQEAEKAKGAIAEAKDTDGVNQAKANGIKAMDDQHKSGDPVESRKEQAKADIDAAAEKVKGEIDADGTLANRLTNKNGINSNKFPKTGAKSSLKFISLGVFSVCLALYGLFKLRK